ncbi:MAG TPA: hypothetical protein VGH74_17970 [Planctomycetaceae bacterium]
MRSQCRNSLGRKTLAALAACFVGGLLLWTHRWGDPSVSPAETLAAENPFKWYRGNIHTHTLWSDGDDYPEMVALWYKEHGYDFLSFSDHNTILKSERWTDVVNGNGGQRALDKLKARFSSDWIEERTNAKHFQEVRLKTFAEIVDKIASPGRFLLIQGEEISDAFQNVPIHMNATNLRELIPPMGGESFHEVMQRNTDALVAQRERTGQSMIIHLNHPNFQYGITAEDLARVRGENFFEVYNGHCKVNNDGDEYHASAERIWDVILTLRITALHLPLMWGLATDDGHHYHDIPSRHNEPGRGWIVVLARSLTATELIKSMERGWFYASTGVTVDRFAVSRHGIEVRIKPEEGVEYTIDFIGTQTGFDVASEAVLGELSGASLRTTRRYSNDIGRVLKSYSGTRAVYEFGNNDLYVRPRVTSTKMHPNPSIPGEYERAWCQPVRGPAGWRIR